MQTVSSGWAHNIAKASRRIGYGTLISWLRTTASSVQFFTINQSTIGGPDPIKGGGSFVTFFDTFEFDDYSRDTMSFSVSRKLGQYPFGVIMAEADIELDNTSRKFLPDHDATIGSGILPNRPVKLSLGIEQEFMKVFVGFTEMPESTLNDRVTWLHAFDAMEYINDFVSTASGAQVNKFSHEIMEDLLFEMGFGETQFVLEKSLQGRIGYLATNEKKAGEIFRQLTEAEQSMMLVDENGIIRHWNRQHFTTTSGVNAFELSYSSLEDIKWLNTPVINDVIVRARPRELQAEQIVYRLDLPILIDGNDSKTIFLDFTDENGAMIVTSITNPVGSATESSRFQASSDSDGGGINRTNNVTLSEAQLLGDTIKLTFDNAASGPSYVWELVITGTPARVRDVYEEREQNQESIDTYGRNPANNGETIIIQNDLIQDADTARSLAYTLVKEYKDPRKRYEAPVAVGSNPALQIGDHGTMTIADTGVVSDVWIVGIENQISRDGDYDQVLMLEERNISQYFTINVSRINGTDTIAP